MMATDSYLFVFCTVPGLETAEKIGKAVVEEHLAACATRVPGAHSIYRWQGAVEEADEILLILKTTAGRFEALEKAIRRLHPYEVPEIVALPIAKGSAPYLSWIEESCW